jgi:hypothetical protein
LDNFKQLRAEIERLRAKLQEAGKAWHGWNGDSCWTTAKFTGYQNLCDVMATLPKPE